LKFFFGYSELGFVKLRAGGATYSSFENFFGGLDLFYENFSK